MIDYIYTAKDKQTGESRKGKISADSKNAAAGILNEKQLYPIKIELAADAEPIWKKAAFGSGVKTKDRVIFTRQLSTLVKAGLPITQALNTAIEQVNNTKFKGILQKIATSVEGGQSLSSSFAQYPQLFNHIFISLVDAGEQSGTLDESLLRLADQQEKQQQISGKVRGALVYPSIVFAVIIGVVIFMVTTVLPQVGTLYKELGQKLPIITSGLLAVSNAIIRFWYLFILLIVAMVLGIRVGVKTPKGREIFDRLKLKAPILGPLFKKVYAARFTRTLSSLINSGVPLLRSLKIAGESVDNIVVQKVIDKAAEKVKTGESLSSALTGHDEIVQLVPQMINVGEESGSLGDMLEKVATFFEDEVDQTVKNVSAIIEPVMIVFLGVTVLFIVIAVLFPIYNLVSVIGNTGSGGGTGGF
ncbi:MAG: type II secretion system F family protein [Candidatus Saccharibacteria bacterium]